MMKLLNLYKDASDSSGRSILILILEALRLRVSSKKLGLTEYIDFQLYKEDLSWTAKMTYGGQRTQAAIEEMLVDDYSRFLSLDKVTMYALLKGLDLPIPNIRATYRSLRPSNQFQIESTEELARYLEEPGNLPVYIKRSFGSFGRGNVLIVGVEGTQLLFGDGSTESLIDFVDSLDDSRTLGWILQDPLTPHSAIMEMTGSDKISGLRIHTFLGTQESKIIKAILKINAGKKDYDNFEHGASGNMLAAVDVTTGRVVRAISGTGLLQEEIPVHPMTGMKIVGFQIPYWKAVVELVNSAQMAFPGFICPGWDIALCESGPKILEVNAFGDIDLSQHAYRYSFFDDEFLSCLQERNLGELLDETSGANVRSSRNNRIGLKRHHWHW